ncbi:glutamine amidotransferase of anthranilate synthase [Candidatus Tremblaya phenacola PAVE]|nr:glutamine amidotransferase of anthranilate synthase [Candidatus Tremblaya phenacola PAVE]
MILVIDNYDSFTYNLVSYFNEAGEDVAVCENDCAPTSLCSNNFHPNLLCFSPGPGSPTETRAVSKILKSKASTLPTLGICLGHQIIGEFWGGALFQSQTVSHGKVVKIYHNNGGVFAGLPQGIWVTRYHSLTLEDSDIPKNLEVTAWTTNNEIMGIRHRHLPLEGIQFHPESLFSQFGRGLIQNFIRAV